MEDVLENNIDQITLPVLPVNIENIPVFINILKEIETEIPSWSTEVDVLINQVLLSVPLGLALLLLATEWAGLLLRRSSSRVVGREN